MDSPPMLSWPRPIKLGAWFIMRSETLIVVAIECVAISSLYFVSVWVSGTLLDSAMHDWPEALSSMVMYQVPFWVLTWMIIGWTIAVMEE